MPWIVVWMGAPMFFLTFYFAFINLRSFKQASRLCAGTMKMRMRPAK